MTAAVTLQASAAAPLRDRLAVPVANLALRLTSRRYRALVKGSIEYGMRAAVRDQAEGHESPPDWRS